MALTHWHNPAEYAARKTDKISAKAKDKLDRLSKIDADRTKMTPAEVRAAVADCAALLRQILAVL